MPGGPAGSLVIFAKATCHSHSPTPATGVDRVAILSRYSHIQTKWHNWEPHPDVLAAMSPMRQTLFRPTRFAGNAIEDGDTI